MVEISNRTLWRVGIFAVLIIMGYFAWPYIKVYFQETCTDIQIPYDNVESYVEPEPYQGTEYYTETVNAKSCDVIGGCSCLHYSWLGAGACDSCVCQKSRSVTKYRDVTKTRTVTKYKTGQQCECENLFNLCF